MNTNLYDYFSRISCEEQAILDGNSSVQRQIYTDAKDFVIDSRKLLRKGKLISARHHTRFVHFPMHRHNYVEIIYMFRGHTTHILGNGEQVVLEQGDLLFLNQNVEHEILPADKEDIAVNFIVLPEFFDTAFRMLEDKNLMWDFLVDILTGSSERAFYLYFQTMDELPVQNLLENMLWAMVHERENRRNIDQTTMGLLFLHLVNLCGNIRYGSSNPYEQECVARILSYIEAGYRTASLEELCGELNQKPSSLSKFISKHTGSTFKELLLAKRMNQAAYLLSTTGLSVADIIVAVGYDNTSYFYRVFRERFGMTPKEYRESVRDMTEG
ncbi:MAG: AraC family transcriptional regulator [Lachnospiraceae bacterium]|nr:AraC family transcriptional regulator [Lachnospiraceae bacterium]